MEQQLAGSATLPTDHVHGAARLRYFPITLFAAVMGFTGSTIAFQRAETILQLPFRISPVLLAVSATLFVLVSLLYGWKLLRHPAEVRTELLHPVRLNFFPTFAISLLLFSIATLTLQPALSFALWIAGTLAQTILAMLVLSFWLHGTHFQLVHFNPAWFIPAVGNLIVPVAGAVHGQVELSWLFFSVGMLFWVMLFTIIILRMVFYPALPERLRPTLFIVLAPPAIGVIAYVRLMEYTVEGFQIDVPARMLYYIGLFLFVFLVLQTPALIKLPFAISWWAYTFPIAGLTIASLLFYSKLHYQLLAWIAGGLLTLLSGLLLLITLRTLQAAWYGKICVPEG